MVPEAACSASLSRTCFFEAGGVQSSCSHQTRCSCSCHAEAELLPLWFLEAAAEQAVVAGTCFAEAVICKLLLSQTGLSSSWS